MRICRVASMGKAAVLVGSVVMVVFIFYMNYFIKYGGRDLTILAEPLPVGVEQQQLDPQGTRISQQHNINPVPNNILGLVEQVNDECKTTFTLGKQNDLEWTACATPVLTKGQCIIYHFSDKLNEELINDVYNTTNCDIFLYSGSHQPSKVTASSKIHFGKKGLAFALGNGKQFDKSRYWTAITLNTAFTVNKHEEKIIDYLNIDIDYDLELKSMQTILYSRDLRRVNHLALTVYTQPDEQMLGTQMESGIKKVMQRLQNEGFRKWRVMKCPSVSRIVKPGLSCYILSFYNTNPSTVLYRVDARREVTWENPTDDVAAEIQFDKYVHELTYPCKKPVRLGNAADGGWEICLDIPLNNPCLIYSFGINWDFSFDDAVARDYKCTVRAFDPSMNLGDSTRGDLISFYKRGLGGSKTTTSKQWQINTLKGLMEEAGDAGKTIDYLKIDIEYAEWDSFKAMLADGLLKNVKQLAFETHSEQLRGKPTTLSNYNQYMELLQGVEKLGFQRWSIHNNQWGMYRSTITGDMISCCYEMSYVNTNFLPASA